MVVHDPPCLTVEEHAGNRIVEQRWWPPVLDDDVDRWRKEYEEEAREAARALDDWSPGELAEAWGR